MWSAHRSWRFYLLLLRKSSHIDLRGIDIIISYFTKSEHHHLRTKILVLHSSQVMGLSLPNNIIEQLRLTSLSKIKSENLRPIQSVIISTICIFYQVSFLRWVVSKFLNQHNYYSYTFICTFLSLRAKMKRK